MYRTLALTTALTVFATLPANPAAAAVVVQLLMEEHYSDAGYEVDLYVTRGADGGLLSEATIVDPASGEAVTAVDVWTDGTTVWWDGVIDGERINGSMPSPDLSGEDPPPPPEPLCFTPITAVICLGAVVVLAAVSDCAHTTNICPIDTEIPDGGGGVPPDDGGDGDGDGDGNSGGGGDED